MGRELLPLNTVPQELTQRLAADLTHARARRPIRHTAIDQIHRPARRATTAEQLHRHLHHRPIGLLPGGLRDGVAVVKLLPVEALRRTLPVTDHLGGFTVSLLRSGTQFQTTGKQFVDVANADIGITNIGIIPSKRENNRLLRLARRSHLETDTAPRFHNVPAAAELPNLLAEARLPVLVVDDDRHGRAQNVPKTSPSGPDRAG